MPRFPKKCGFKPKGRACEAVPEGTLREIDQQAVKSLEGNGKNKMTPTYRKYRWNQR